MTQPQRPELESFDAAADGIETFFRRRGLTVAGRLSDVIRILRQAYSNFEQDQVGETVENPLFLKPPAESGEPDPIIVALVQGQQLGTALSYFCEQSGCVQVDDTLLTRELCASKPMGYLDAATTIVNAHRIHSAAGGTLRLFGNGHAGRDILWTHPEGTQVSIECKTRDWQTFWDNPQAWEKWARHRLRQMRLGLAKHPPLRYSFLQIPTNPAWAQRIQDSVEAFAQSIAHDVESVGEISGFAIQPLGFARSAAGQAVGLNRAVFVDMPRRGRLIPPEESNARRVFETIFGHKPDPEPSLLDYPRTGSRHTP